jgi:membrane associated rhomboid family serine protease
LERERESGKGAGARGTRPTPPSLPPPPPPPPLYLSPPGGPAKGRPGSFGKPFRRVTDSLLIANVLFYLAQVGSRQALTVWGAKINAAIAAGEVWRLLTPALLHGNALHLATNNYALASLGPIVERISGHARFGSIYTVSAIAGTAASYVFTKAPSVGASGAIFGVGGALAVFFYRHRSYFGSTSDAVLKALGQSLAINTAMGFAIANVDNWGHAGGLAGGALAAALLGPVLVVDRSGKGGSGSVRDEPPLKWFAAAPISLSAK